MKYLLFSFLLFSISAFGQQEPLSGMYWNNYSYFNPAMSGVEYKYEGNVSWRNQWDKVNGAPNTLFVNAGMNLVEKHGVGVNYVYETIGDSRIHRAKLNYNYQLKLDKTRKLVFGTAFTIHQFNLVPEWIAPTTENDPSLPTAHTATNYFVDLGVAYYGDQLTAGFSATQLPLYRIEDSYSPKTHLFGNVRYHLYLSPQPNYFILETQMRTDFVRYSQDFNVGYNWRNILEGGVGYRTSDAIIFNLTGIVKERIRIGYLYGFTINKLSSVSRGTHEVTVGVRFPN